MSEAYPQFAAFNNTFNAPPDEPLRLVGGSYVFTTDQQRKEGHMLLTLTVGNASKPKEFLLRHTSKGFLILKFGSPPRMAQSWLDLADRLDLSRRPPLDEERNALLALFRQVGEDPAYKDYFRLELNSPRGASITL